MKQKYKVMLDLRYEGNHPILKINPVSLNKIIPYPLNVISELNVPIQVQKLPAGEGFDLEYFLDFDNSYNGKKEAFGPEYSVRLKLQDVLGGFVKAVDEDLREALYNKSNLKRKKFSFVEDNGLKQIVSKKRLGKPKKHRRFVTGKHKLLSR